MTSSQDIFGPTNPTWRTEIDCSLLWKVKTSWHLFLCENILNFWRKRQISWMLNGSWVLQQGQKLIVICLSTIQAGNWSNLGLGKVFNKSLITMRTFFRHKEDFSFTYYYAKKGQVFRTALHVNYVYIFGLKFYSRSLF